MKEPIKKYRADKQTDTNYFSNIDSNFTKQTFCFFKVLSATVKIVLGILPKHWVVFVTLSSENELQYKWLMQKQCR